MGEDEQRLGVGNVGENEVYREGKETGQGGAISQDGQVAAPTTIACLVMDGCAIALGLGLDKLPGFRGLQGTVQGPGLGWEGFWVGLGSEFPVAMGVLAGDGRFSGPRGWLGRPCSLAHSGKPPSRH